MSTEQIVVVKPRGRVDLSAARALEAELAQHLDAQHKRILVDLGEARYMDSNGLRVLLGALKEARQLDGDLKICCLNKRVMEIFSTAGLDHIFEIYATRAEAEREFG